MKILLDLIPLKRGGGAQVGMTLVEQIEASGGAGHEWQVVVTAGSALDRRLASARYCHVIRRVENTIGARFLFEVVGWRRLVAQHKPDIIYSQFGAGLPRVPVPAVVGSAYSNLYYPEVDFWGNWPLVRRWIYRLRDFFRLRRTLQADALVFETDLLAERAVALFALPRDRVTAIKASPSPFVQPTRHNSDVAERCAGLPDGFRVLLLSGWHPNKGLGMLPRIAASAQRASGEKDFYFVTTLRASHPASRAIRREAEALGIAPNIIFFDAVEAAGCVELYRSSDAVLLLSVLESFSNNIIEAWSMQRPLVITDAEWSRRICGDAAVYVDRSDPRDVAAAVVRLRLDCEHRQRLIENGKEMLRRHPDPRQKFEQHVQFLERVRMMGPRAHIKRSPILE